MRSSHHTGFTLAEVLIALGLLGVVAAFTIPKIIHVSTGQEANVKVKEAIFVLGQTWYNKKIQNTFVSGSGKKLFDNLDALNTVSEAATAVDALTAPYNGLTPVHPCMTGGGIAEAKTGWIQLPNGVVISGLGGNSADDDIPATLETPTDNYVVCIDVNGHNTPNTLGQDVYLINFNPSGAFVGGHTGTGNANGKNFSYGGITTPIYNAAGTGNALAINTPGVAGLLLTN